MEDLKHSCEGANFKDGYTADAGDEEEIRQWLIEIGELEAEGESAQYEQSVEFIKECAKGSIVDDGLFTRDFAAIENYVDGIVDNQ